MDRSNDDTVVGRRQHLVARALAVLIALLVICAFVLLATGIGVSNLATNAVSTTSTTVKENRPFYVLIIGSDSRKGTALYTGNSTDHAQVDQHADVLTLVRISPKKHTVTLVSIPTRIVLRGQKAPLCDTLLTNDPKRCVRAVEDLAGVKIPYYMLVTFRGLETVVNEFGTLTVDVDASVKSQDPITAKNVVVKRGPRRQLLASGALAYARAWDEYPSEKDLHRQSNVRAIEIAMIETVLGKNEDDALHLAETLCGNVVTNMDVSVVKSLVKNFLYAGSESVTIYEYYGPGKVTDKQKNLIAQDKTAWSHLMYVVDRGYDPNLSYTWVKKKEDQKAAEKAEQEAAQQYGYTDNYGIWHNGGEQPTGEGQEAAPDAANSEQ